MARGVMRGVTQRRGAALRGTALHCAARHGAAWYVVLCGTMRSVGRLVGRSRGGGKRNDDDVRDA
jgi:hypothetical protein